MKNYNYLLGTIACILLYIAVQITNKPAPCPPTQETPAVSVPAVSREAAYSERLMKDYQVEMQFNGDAIIYKENQYIGTVKYSPTCEFHKIIMADND